VHSDEELVKLFVLTQKNSFFEELYERYADKVYRKCLTLVKDAARAEDFTHDIFLKLIVKLGSFKEEARFSTWLYSITYNYCMDQLRVNKKRGEVNLEEEVDVMDEDVDVSVLIEEKDADAKRLHRAIDTLTTEERSILMMKYLDDLSIRDIASVFRITESAVKMRLLRSRENLRKKYLEVVVLLICFLIKLVSEIFIRL
jgi:RNA polymerase sigma factor (sigma-70 family)